MKLSGGKPALAFLAVWGPGLLVMLADSDAGNIVTAAEAGTRFGYRLLPLLILLIPVLFVVQDLAVRLGIFGGRGLAAMIRARFGLAWAWGAVAALALATAGSLVTEFTGIAGVGEMYGVSRHATLPLAAAGLLATVLTGAYRRVERIAIVIGLFELAFFGVAWASHPDLTVMARQAAEPVLRDSGFRYLAAALIGASFNPWMVFYQQSATVAKRLTPANYRAARWDTAIGAMLTQCLTAAVLVAVATTLGGGGATLPSVGAISAALTPLLGAIAGQVLFGVGVVGAAMVAAIVCSLALAWAVADIASRHGNPRWFRGAYTAAVLASLAAVWAAPDLVRLNVAAQVVNAVLLPLVTGVLILLAATALPPKWRLHSSKLWLVAGLCALVCLAGLAGALAALQ